MVDFSQLEGIQGVRGNKSSSISLWLIFLKLSQVLSLLQSLRYMMTSSGQDCYWSLSDLVFLSSLLILHYIYEWNSVDSTVHVSYFLMFVVMKG